METITSAEPYLIIGIDPGVNTGYAIYNQSNNKLSNVCSLPIHRVFLDVLIKQPLIKLVRIEDARQRKYFTGGREKLQGAGSIKRDCKIWEDFLTDHNIPFELIAPKDNKTKLRADSFKKLTGYEYSTNEHGRDAGMLVYGL